MAAYRRVYDSRHLQADCQEPGSAPEPYCRQSIIGYPCLLCCYRRPRTYVPWSVCVCVGHTSERCKTAEPINWKRSSQSAPADHVPGYAHLPPHRWTTIYHGCERSSASGRSHMRVLPPGTLCPTTSVPSLILPSSENCSNHTVFVRLLIFVFFLCFLRVLAFG